LLATFYPLASAADGSPNSLRAAIIQANANGQNNTINLQPGLYKLTIPNLGVQENSAATGDLDLTAVGRTLTIQGAGMHETTIDGNKLDRVFQVLSGVNAIIRDLSVFDGLAVDDGDPGSSAASPIAGGGGILNAGTLELDRVAIADCTAQGAAGMTGAASPDDATGHGAAGGGIANSGSLILNGCYIGDNAAQGGNGGTSNGTGQNGGFAAGGGIATGGTLTVSQSVILYNTAQGGTGGAGATVDFGTALPGGDGGEAFGGGMFVFANAGPIRVIDSTVVGNYAYGGGGGDGGPGFSDGVFGFDGGGGGNGGDAQGAGVGAASAANFDNSTIAFNTAIAGNAGAGGQGGIGSTAAGNPGGSGQSGSTAGGGVFADSGSSTVVQLTAISTIFARNTAVGGIGPDVDGAFGIVANTLLGDPGGATGITSGVTGNIVGVNPNFGQFGTNGGLTPTLPLMTGSPAINAGSNPLRLTADQRGYGPRSARGFTDMGAFETGAKAPPPVRLTVKIVKVQGAREIEVFYPGAKVPQFAVFPFGKSYRGTFQVGQNFDNDGFPEIVVRRPVGRNGFVTAVISGRNGNQFPVGVV
jgi:hypothetical protein